MANKKLRKRALAVERFNLDAYQVQIILDLKISFDSLTKRQARAWDNNRWTLAEYLEYRYKQEFGKSRPERPAFMPSLSKPKKIKRVNGANRPTSAHPFYKQKAMVIRRARERAHLTVLELAKMTNIRPEIIETLEDPDSRKAVSFETIVEIATALGLELRVGMRLKRPRASEERGPSGVTEQIMPLRPTEVAGNGSSDRGGTEGNPPSHARRLHGSIEIETANARGVTADLGDLGDDGTDGCAARSRRQAASNSGAEARLEELAKGVGERRS